MIKKYMGILAVVVALCGLLTVSASAADYLYNGVLLPDYNEYRDFSDYPYVVIFADSETTYRCILSDTEMYSNGAESYYAGNSGAYYCQIHYSASSGWYSYGEIGKWLPAGSGFGGLTQIKWSNYNVYDEAGNLVMAASLPVDPNEPPPTEGSGFDTLEGLTVFFSSSSLDYEKGSVWWRVEGLNPELTYTVQVKLYGSDDSTDIVDQYECTVSETDTYSDMRFYSGLESEHTYRAVLTIWQTYEYTKGAETTFTTDAESTDGGTTDSDDTGDSGTTTDPDNSEEEKDSLEEWDKVTEVPGEVTDKTNKGDQLIEDMESLDKPDPDELVPDVEVDTETIGKLFGDVLNDSLVVTMLTLSATFALVGFVLFGKRG